VRVSDKRIAEWWEAPGIDGREAFDEEILYLNSLTEEISLPRWAILVRDRMPRWGFEPCAHRFLEGLEQVLHMIGAGRVWPRFGGCGDVPFAVQWSVRNFGGALVQWAEDGTGSGTPVTSLGTHTAERAEAARAMGEVVLQIGQGAAALDATLERWAERAKFSPARALVDGDETPLSVVAQHPCAYTLLWNLNRLAHSIGNSEPPSALVCVPSLLVAPQLDPGRILTLREVGEALSHWLQERPPQNSFEERVHALVGPRDEVRHWLVASLYKTLKLWQVHLDEILSEKRAYMSLI
jgi:hypothetical protein